MPVFARSQLRKNRVMAQKELTLLEQLQTHSLTLTPF